MKQVIRYIYIDKLKRKLKSKEFIAKLNVFADNFIFVD